MRKNSETQVKIDSVRKAKEVHIFKGHKISQLDQNISSVHFLNPYFWVVFFSL